MEAIKRIPRVLKYSEYIVSFSYETYKGYYKEQKRSIYCKDRNECVECFKEWAKKQRTMSNVQILGIEKTNKEQKIIEI